MTNFYGQYVGFGSGGVTVEPYHGYGSNYAFSAAGTTGPPAWPNIVTIDKFAIASVADATDVSDMTVARRGVAGAFSTTHGYGAGGDGSPGTIDKYSFTSGGNATGVGDLVAGATGTSRGCSSTEFGYCSGGNTGGLDMIQRWSFAADLDATDVGNLSVGDRNTSPGNAQSRTYGYWVGGDDPSVDVIDKWAFASATTDAEDVGNLTAAKTSVGSNSSSTHGYASGGAGLITAVERFSFAAGTQNAAGVGDLAAGNLAPGGQNSETYGFVSGGLLLPATNMIQQIAFGSDTVDAVDRNANLFTARGYTACAQY